MPPRLNKRQLREQEELEALKIDDKKDAEEQDESSTSVSPVAPPKPAVGGFAAVSTILQSKTYLRACILHQTLWVAHSWDKVLTTTETSADMYGWLLAHRCTMVVN